MNKQAVLVWVFLVSCLFSGVLQAKADVQANINGAKTISAEDLIELVDEYENLVIIDSRKPSDHEKGFIEGSVGLPDTKTSPESLAEHISTKTTAVIFYCNGVKCGRSVKATKKAIANGYSNLYWFRGGWEEWTAKGYPVAR